MRLPWIAFLALPFLSCKHQNLPSSRVSHDEDRFQNSEEPSQWTILTDEEYAKGEKRAKESILPNDHVMTIRLQGWLDAMRSEVVKTNPSLSVAPRPQIKIVESVEPNAYVGNTNVCVDLPLSFDEGAEGPSDYLGMEVGMGECKPFQGTYDAKVNFVKYRLGWKPGCTTQPLDQGLKLSAACLPEGTDPKKSFKGLKSATTHNFITVFTGQLKGHDEDEVIEILAHELGHYYMGHGTEQDPSLYGYIYRWDGKPGKPKALPKDDPFHALAEEIRKYGEIQFPTIEGQKFHPLWANFISNVIINLDDDPQKVCLPGKADCLVACKDLETYKASIEDGYFSTFPFSLRRDQATLDAYFLYEKKVEACLTKLPAERQNFILQFSADSALSNLAKITVPDPKPEESLYSLLLRTDKDFSIAADKLAATAKGLLASAAEKGLGWYTQEQEADDIAVDLLARLGVNPEAGILANIKAVKLEDPVEGEACMKAYEKGFPKPISIGDLSEVHHDHCYRAYNMFLEVNIHKAYYEKIASNSRPVIQPELDWEAAVNALNK